MKDPYVIRLRGPWECEPLARESAAGDNATTDGTAAAAPDSGVPARRRLQMPADWRDAFGADFHGRVLFRRRFHRPTGLEPREEVWVVIDRACACGSYAVNGRALGVIDATAPAAESDVTELLAADNVLEIEVELPPPALPPAIASAPAVACAIGEVRLEIRTAG